MAESKRDTAIRAYENALEAKTQERERMMISWGFKTLRPIAQANNLPVDDSKGTDEKYRLKLIRSIAEIKAKDELPMKPWIAKWILQREEGPLHRIVVG